MTGRVGTGITGCNYTAFPDTGVLSAAECVQFGGYIARAVSFPVILDGDTGHGGAPAVRRLVHDCIRAGLAGIRIDAVAAHLAAVRRVARFSFYERVFALWHALHLPLCFLLFISAGIHVYAVHSY